jgi:glutathione S-transferase
MLEELRETLPALQYEHLQANPQSDEARAHHPMGKVPSLCVRDGAEEFTMFESAAINTWLGDRFREYGAQLVPNPGSAERAVYCSFVHFMMAECDSSGLWIHRKLESLGEKKAFGAVRYALLPARLQFDRAMVGVRAQLEKQRVRSSSGAVFYLLGSSFTAADVLLVHICDWASSIEVDKGGWFSKYKADDVFQTYLASMRARPAYLRAKRIQEESPMVT